MIVVRCWEVPSLNKLQACPHYFVTISMQLLNQFHRHIMLSVTVIFIVVTFISIVSGL